LRKIIKQPAEVAGTMYYLAIYSNNNSLYTCPVQRIGAPWLSRSVDTYNAFENAIGMHVPQGHAPVAMKLQKAAHVVIAFAQTAGIMIMGPRGGGVPPQLAAVDRGAKALLLAIMVPSEMKMDAMLESNK
jgi:hypothetical protein